MVKRKMQVPDSKAPPGSNSVGDEPSNAGVPATSPPSIGSMPNDQATDDDQLDFDPYVETLFSIIADPDTKTPLTVGIFGDWGAGKTSLLLMLRKRLEEQAGKGPHLTVWFNAWKYDREDSLWRALLLRVVDALRASIEERSKNGDNAAKKEVTTALAELDELEQTLYHAVEHEEKGGLQVDFAKLLIGSAETGLKALIATIPGLSLAASVVEELTKDISKTGPSKLMQAFERERIKSRVAQLGSMEQFSRRFEHLVAAHVTDGRLIVFIDDLDRCLPEKAIGVLEAIKLFLDVENAVFVIAVDRDIIARGIRVKYDKIASEIDGTRYLEKIVQLPFDLPPLELDDLQAFVERQATFEDQRNAKAFAVGFRRANPRRIKRSIAVFLLLSRLTEAREQRARLRAETDGYAAANIRAAPLNDLRLAKVVVIQQGHPELYAILLNEPGSLAELENHFVEARERSELDAMDGVAGRRGRSDTARTKGGTPFAGTPSDGPQSKPDEDGAQIERRRTLPERLDPFGGSRSLKRLLEIGIGDNDQAEVCFGSLGSDDIRPYFSLVRTVTIAPVEPAGSGILVPELVRVEAGSFIRGSNKTDDGASDDEVPQRNISLAAFEIGRTPITNAEYASFISASGHPPPARWEGNEPPNDLTDHPVVSVSHSDALAYCTWLTTVSARSDGRLYRLPTEAEWEKAARGTDGRVYPWGNDFDPRHCNSLEGGPGRTTAVRAYSPDGDSPFGCADMAGNVWEWCGDWFDSSYYKDAPEIDPSGPKTGQHRVFRGGSWNNDARNARCAFRDGDEPDLRYTNLGFRVVHAPRTS